LGGAGAPRGGARRERAAAERSAERCAERSAVAEDERSAKLRREVADLTARLCGKDAQLQAAKKAADMAREAEAAAKQAEAAARQAEADAVKRAEELEEQLRKKSGDTNALPKIWALEDRVKVLSATNEGLARENEDMHSQLQSPVWRENAEMKRELNSLAGEMLQLDKYRDAAAALDAKMEPRQRLAFLRQQARKGA